jgi:hypothetical protein
LGETPLEFRLQAACNAMCHGQNAHASSYGLAASCWSNASIIRHVVRIGMELGMNPLFGAELRRIVNFRPVEKFIAVVGHFGQQRQATPDSLDVFVHAAFVKRKHRWCWFIHNSLNRS